MNYFHIEVATLSDFPFRRSDYSDRGIWVTLLAYCVLQENGGTIKNVANWTEFESTQVLGVSLEQLKGNHSLWTFRGDDLVVWRYPAQDEKNLSTTREINALKAKIRWVRQHVDQLKRDHAAALPLHQPGIANSIAEKDAERAQLELQLHSLSNAKDRRGKERKGEKKKGEDKSSPPNPLKGGKHLGKLPDEQEEPIRSRMLTVGTIKGRLRSTRWSAKEWQAFAAAGLHAMSEADFSDQTNPLLAYYAATPGLVSQWNGKPDGAGDYRRRDLATLLNNWAGEVDRARAFVHWRAKIYEEQDAGRAPLTQTGT